MYNNNAKPLSANFCEVQKKIFLIECTEIDSEAMFETKAYRGKRGKLIDQFPRKSWKFQQSGT